MDALLRAIVVRKLGAAGYKPIVEEAKKLFEKSLEDPSVLPASIFHLFINLLYYLIVIYLFILFRIVL